MIKLTPMLDTITGKYFQPHLHEHKTEEDLEMSMTVKVVYLDSDQTTPMLDAINLMDIPEDAKRQLRNQFRTFHLPPKTTRGQYIDTATGENVYPDPQTGEPPTGPTIVTELQYWQSISKSDTPGTTMSEGTYALIKQSMKKIVEKNLGVTSL